MWFVVAMSFCSIGYGIYAVVRADRVAQGNAAFIASGEESYFEQRRGWKAYGTIPPSDSATVRKKGRKEIMIGVIGLVVAASFTYFTN
ncbi:MULTISPECIES: hypothetical protein [unclassified Sphingobium]|uniref:hypothetical protein n=1 Tax=unclassified Sphingobium TaxID=2611147 RepID=UPI0007700EA6|nr:MULTISPECIES: hypothetical protein [unclassified Sphingobium]AMK24566.1 hypothetical protein K426_18180 [Sphingobium sp. TKS]NML88565.1 hypothetical protein [Sphingobium sp. TB-6]